MTNRGTDELMNSSADFTPFSEFLKTNNGKGVKKTPFLYYLINQIESNKISENARRNLK